jgi:carbamoyl-phosphate synthase large subunit
MRTILITGAGGAPGLNFTRSLRDAPDRYRLVGIDCNKYNLQRAETDEAILCPRADDGDFLDFLAWVIAARSPDFLHSQSDEEIALLAVHAAGLGTATFLPSAESVRVCQDKFLSYARWSEGGLKVPATRLLNTADDLRDAFAAMGSPLWLRETHGGAGRGAFLADTFDTGRMWVEIRKGWRIFTAAEYLSPDSITWQSIWKKGELIVAQGRKRIYWEMANRAPAGVTGVTGTGVTASDPLVDTIAQKAILAIDPSPHGIWSVDLTYDRTGTPNPTEINIGRFFTTHYFFTKAGLNMPYILVKLAMGEEPPAVSRKINPLPPGLAWIRGMDIEPVLCPVERIDACAGRLDEWRRRH